MVNRGHREAVAAFDFDGTLSTRDNVVPFLRLVAGSTTAAARALVETGASLVARGPSAWNREDLKSEVTARVFAGKPARGVEVLAHDFAADITAHHLRAEAMERVDWHRAQGHRLVIVSASFANYLRPVADTIGFDAVLATELEVGDDGRLTGRIAGHNVRGPEKARRLDEWLGNDDAYVFAYGDSSGDRELWARADRAVRMGRRAHLPAE